MPRGAACRKLHARPATGPYRAEARPKVVEMMGEPALAAGWYPDPWEQGELRWHDGTEWTGHVHVAQAPEPAVAAQPEPVQQAQEAPTLAWAQAPEQAQELEATMQFQVESVQAQPLAVFAQQAPEPRAMAMPSMEEMLAGDRDAARTGPSRRLVLLGVMAVVAIAAVAFVLLGRGGDAPVTDTPAVTDPAVAIEPAATAPAPDPGGLQSAAQLAQDAPGAAPAEAAAGAQSPTDPAAVPAPPAAPAATPAPAPAATGEQIPELAQPASDPAAPVAPAA